MTHLLRYFIFRSLKKRLIATILLASLFPVSLIGGVSYYSIVAILKNKVQRGVQTTLEQERIGLDSTLKSLDYASQQLAYYGNINENYRTYKEKSDALEKAEIEGTVLKFMTLVNYTNPDLGLMTFYVPEDHNFVFSNMNVNPQIHLENEVKLAKPLSNLSFNGPHQTIYPYSTNKVLSVLRIVDSAEGDNDIAVYIETNFKVFQEKLSKVPYGMPVEHMLVNQEGVIVYGENESLFQLGTKLPLSNIPNKAYSIENNYLLFSSMSPYGWTLVTAIKEQDFNKEIRQFLIRFSSIAALSICFSILLAWLMWKAIYAPLIRLKKHIQYTATNRLDVPIHETGVTEFDELLIRFGHMNKEIGQLINEVGEKERNKQKLVVEKLMYQINPHFIHNTLNTVQWLAKMNNQSEIFRLVSLFIEVMDYNLGKEGEIVTVEQEIRALQDYVELQQIRYNHAFLVEFEVDEAVLELPMPRFLLQPMVENALYHGFKDKDGSVKVKIEFIDREHFVIIVRDNGVGMSKEKIRELLSDDQKQTSKVGLGIGLQYVKNTIKAYYGESYRLEVDSEPGLGTAMILRLPIHMKEGAHD
ncbi:MAG: histidine kinase [Gorillibacterium sp.]|nr:histidine kinase [Gorillibacterium sp.]